MFKNKSLTVVLARAGVIAALYTATSLIIAPFASGAIQVRLSEALTLLPLIFPEAVPALFIGCLLSNLITGCAPLDIVLGSMITLIAAALTCGVGIFVRKTALRIVVGGAFPVLLNAFILPILWVYCYGAIEYIYIVQAAFLLLGQGLSVYAIGTPIYLAIRKKVLRKK